jgi:uncharacterized membrane protein
MTSADTPRPDEPTGVAPIPVRQVGSDRPWRWLAAGAADLRQAAGVSLGYGAIWVVLSFILTAGLYAAGLFYWLLPMTAGFMFMGPLVAVGTYAISRSLAAGETPSIAGAFAAWRKNTMQLALMGVTLMIFMIAWMRIATILFALFFGMETPNPQDLYSTLLLSPNGLGMIAVGTAIGAVLTFGAFSISVISIPLLLDREVSVLEAVEASLRCVALNVRTMLLWAFLLTVFILIGMFTFYIGLIVVLPLLGHASWHAYRELAPSSPD